MNSNERNKVVTISETKISTFAHFGGLDLLPAFRGRRGLLPEIIDFIHMGS
ncbi:MULTISPECIES: hypothetical protein [Burkholderia cepacia complex]|uniref:hypothetical protein n=1 Tax=Burkholderia cepacia complex TaxID=87882 RepID=UPI00130DCC50|nr:MULTISPECIES: hypothetical protein [Burkholderia cepacia complex]